MLGQWFSAKTLAEAWKQGSKHHTRDEGPMMATLQRGNLQLPYPSENRLHEIHIQAKHYNKSSKGIEK
jgi:hypothetical protein